MILGLSVHAFTVMHVIISLVAIAAGAAMTAGLLQAQVLRGWTGWFLTFTVATSLSGFLFHSAHFGPPHAVGVISLVVLAVSLLALYGQHLAGRWRLAYIVCAILAFYLNVFVLVAQVFDKIPSLHRLAPRGQEPPFVIAQAVVLLVFLWIGMAAVRRARRG
jgi:hypothetical protein